MLYLHILCVLFRKRLKNFVTYCSITIFAQEIFPKSAFVEKRPEYYHFQITQLSESEMMCRAQCLQLVLFPFINDCETIKAHRFVLILCEILHLISTLSFKIFFAARI